MNQYRWCVLVLSMVALPVQAQTIPGDPEAFDFFGVALAAGDFDGDGFVDLAIGTPGETVDGVLEAGAVNVIYGSTGGVASGRYQLWSQNSLGVEGGLDMGDGFGFDLTAGDFNNDGFDDLVIGVPREDVDGVTDAGAVNVIYGSGNGLFISQFWTQNSANIPDEAEASDRFGSALAVGDFNDDGFDDLAIGVPFEDSIAGATHVLYGSANGLTSTGSLLLRQEFGGEVSEPGDVYGLALAAGDFNGDSADDLAIGVPGQDIGSIPNSGVVLVHFGSQGGVTNMVAGLARNSSGPNAGYGRSLAVGNFNGDGFDDLVVGIPGYVQDNIARAGGVEIRTGAQTTPFSDVQFLNQDNPVELLDSSEENDSFGSTLAASDYNNDGRDDLTVGVPFEDVDNVADAGMVHFLRGSPGGVTTAGQGVATQAGGLADDPDEGDQFASSLAFGDFNGDGFADFAIGVPNEDVLGVQDAGAVHVLFYNSQTGMYSFPGEFLYQGLNLPVSAEASPEASALTLQGAVPNPLRSHTTLRYTLPAASSVRIAVYDVLGREVAVLVEAARAAGTHEILFEAGHLPSGTYLVRLAVGRESQTQRMTIVR